MPARTRLVSDASYRQRINIPLDCRDGVCGTCKSFCESGDYELGDYVPDEAMTEDEEEAGYVLTCQMTPKSDLIIRIPATSDVAKTSISTYEGELVANERLSDTALAFSIKMDNRSSLGFLPGQYVNVQVPGTDQARSFSFSSGPGEDEVAFLIRNTTYGVLTTYLRERAKTGDKISFNGPLGSFYLRKIERPVLFLAGGTGLAPFLSMLNKIEQDGGSEHPIHLIFGVTNDPDLVEVEKLEGYASRMPNFTFTCVVASEESSYPNKGFVTHHMKPEHLHDGFVDIYLCGPPPMVDAVRKYLADQGIEPASFYYEKFSGSRRGQRDRRVARQGRRLRRGVRHADGAGAGGRPARCWASSRPSSSPSTGGWRRPPGQYIKDGHFTDPAGFREANSAFHLFPIEATGNDVLLEAYRKLLVQEYMGQVLTPSVDVVGDITQDHIEIVDAFERGDFEALRRIIAEHTDHAKATMRAGIEKPGG